MGPSISQWEGQSHSGQSVSQSVSQTDRQPDQSDSQSVSHSVNQTVSQSVRQTVRQTVSQSVSQSVSGKQFKQRIATREVDVKEFNPLHLGLIFKVVSFLIYYKITPSLRRSRSGEDGKNSAD